MLPRVTNQTMMLAAERRLGARQSRLAAAQDTASSGLRIARPSDDPVGTGDALRIHARIAANDQYKRNIDNGVGWLNALDTALNSATGFLRQVRDLAVQGANASVNQQGRDAAAAQVDALRQELLGSANAQYLGRNVFAGNTDTPGAFTDGTPPVFNGTAGETVQRRIAADQTVRVDGDGAAIFGTGSSSVFTVLDTIASDLRSGVDPSTQLGALDDRMKAVVNGRAEIGSRLAQIQRAGEAVMTTQTTLNAQRSGIEDEDLGKAVLDLQLQQTNYQAALAVTAKTLQPSLMDFLK